MLVSPKIGKFLRAGRQGLFLFFFYFFYSRDIAYQGFAITPMKVRKYIIKAKNFASLLFRLINVNISVNEQPEWFHRAHCRWPFYTHYIHHVHVLDHGPFTDIVSALAI